METTANISGYAYEVSELNASHGYLLPAFWIRSRRLIFPMLGDLYSSWGVETDQWPTS